MMTFQIVLTINEEVQTARDYECPSIVDALRFTAFLVEEQRRDLNTTMEPIGVHIERRVEDTIPTA